MKKAVIFDLDGTLWDATDAVTEVWNILDSQTPDMNCPITKEKFRELQGMTGTQIMSTMLPNLPQERRNELMQKRSALNAEYMPKMEMPLFDGVLETLKELKNEYEIILVSNCSVYYMEIFLSRNGMRELFSDSECAGRTGKSKGENIKEVIRRNDIARAVYVGDTVWDRDAALEANIPFVHAAYGFQQLDSGAAAKIEKFSDLPSVLKNLM
jgi:phosphoglycolate phosphatase